MKKMLLKTCVMVVILSGIAVAGQGALQKLLQKEESLYRTVQENYHQRKGIGKEIAEIEKINAKLGTMRVSGEVADLISYFSLCTEELKRVAQLPHSRENEEILVDLGNAVGEGRQQIEHLQKTQRLSLAKAHP